MAINLAPSDNEHSWLDEFYRKGAGRSLAIASPSQSHPVTLTKLKPRTIRTYRIDSFCYAIRSALIWEESKASVLIELQPLDF
jgi:hypothetical protein